MDATITNISTKIQIFVFILSSLLITFLLFITDSDSNQGGVLDPILTLVIFVGLFTFSQVGFAKLIGNRLLGWTKVMTSIIGGILSTLGLFVLIYTILYLVKF